MHCKKNAESVAEQKHFDSRKQDTKALFGCGVKIRGKKMKGKKIEGRKNKEKMKGF